MLLYFYKASFFVFFFFKQSIFDSQKGSLHFTPAITQMVKRLPEMQETWVSSLDWEDSLEKEMAIHSSIIVWKIPWSEKVIVHGSQRVGYD